MSPSRKIKEPPSCPERRPSFVAASRRVHGGCVAADNTPAKQASTTRERLIWGYDEMIMEK